MTRELREASVVIGAAGINGTGLSSAEKTTINNRLTTLEGVTVPSVLNDLSDVTTSGRTTGSLFRYNGTAWAPYTQPATTIAFGVPITIDGGGAVISTGYTLRGIEIPFVATITGWTIISNVTGSIVLTVSKATYAAAQTYTVISGTEKPTLSSATKNQDLSLTTWTTAVAAGDLLQVAVDSASTLTRVVLNLRMTRAI